MTPPTPRNQQRQSKADYPVIDNTFDYPGYVLRDAKREGAWVKPFYVALFNALMQDDPDTDAALADFMIKTEWPEFIRVFKTAATQAGRTPEQDIAISQREDAEDARKAAQQQ